MQGNGVQGKELRGEKMIGHIENGTEVYCLSCNKIFPVELTLTFDGEYIRCPHCRKVYDVQAYHMHGKVVEKWH